MLGVGEHARRFLRIQQRFRESDFNSFNSILSLKYSFMRSDQHRVFNSTTHEVHPQTGHRRPVASGFDSSEAEVEEEIQERALSRVQRIVRAEVCHLFCIVGTCDESYPQGSRSGYDNSIATTPPAHGTPTGADLPMPGTFTPNYLTASDQSHRGTSQAPQELSLVLYNHVDQSSGLSLPAAPAPSTDPDDPMVGIPEEPSPTVPLETDGIDSLAGRGSLTPRPGSAVLSPSPQAGSQSPVPLTRDKGKGRAERPYSDEESMSNVGEDIEMTNAGTNSTPWRDEYDEVFFVFSCFRN